MSRRHDHLMLGLLLGLSAPAGCMHRQCCLQQTMVSQPPNAPTAEVVGELPAAQAAQLCLAVGEALEKKGFTAEAIYQYENARKHDAQVRTTTARRLAVLYDLQGDARRAESEFLRAWQEQPRDTELLNDVGYFHYRHGHLQAAESWLRNAITANPNCVCAWVNLGQVLARQGRSEESYQAFAYVLRPAEAYSNLGILLAKQGHTAEARNALQQAATLDPGLGQPRVFLDALSDAPGPLPAGITRSTPPVQPRAETLAARSHAPTPSITKPAQTPESQGRPGIITFEDDPPPIQQQQATPKGDAAHVLIIVAEDAELWFDGTATSQKGRQRVFFSPPLTPGKDYTYEIKARWMQDGKVVEEVRSAQVQASAWQQIDFTKPGTPAVRQK